MLGLILRFLLVVIAFRFIGAVVRVLSGGRPPAARVAPPPPPKPLVDRSSAIDVPFTED